MKKKQKKNNIDLESCYQKINRYFLDHGVKIKSPGVYQGVKEDFNTFGSCSGATATNKLVFKNS